MSHRNGLGIPGIPVHPNSCWTSRHSRQSAAHLLAVAAAEFKRNNTHGSHAASHSAAVPTISRRSRHWGKEAEHKTHRQTQTNTNKHTHKPPQAQTRIPSHAEVIPGGAGTEHSTRQILLGHKLAVSTNLMFSEEAILCHEVVSFLHEVVSFPHEVVSLCHESSPGRATT